MYMLKIDPAAFNSGNVFHGIDPVKAKIVIGANWDDPIVPIVSSAFRDRGGSSVVVDCDGIVMTDNTWSIMHKNGLAQMADLVRKATIIVYKDGVAQTATQILDVTPHI